MGILEFQQESAWKDFVKKVGQGLSLHKGGHDLKGLKIDFVYVCESSYEPTIKDWLLFVGKNGLENLSLLVLPRSSQLYAPPAETLFSLTRLLELELRMCIVPPPPPGLSPWTSLRKLSLRLSHLEQGSVETIVSHCPNMEELTLDECSGFSGLNITGEHLKTISITEENLGQSDTRIRVILLPYVKSVIIKLLSLEETQLSFSSANTAEMDLHRPCGSMLDIKKLFDTYPINVKSLVVGGTLFQLISRSPPHLESHAFNLEELIISMPVHSTAAVVSLLRFSPRVKDLKLTSTFGARGVVGANANDLEDHCASPQLLEQVYYNCMNAGLNLPLLRLLLKKSRTLKWMTIRTGITDDDALRVVIRTLLSYSRA